ncbi:MAG: DUF4421 domain-containing protein [Muribaculaceae bacterium]|nr:DUF4421 domain-containing protein [Muribaculaceae bacterium]
MKRLKRIFGILTLLMLLVLPQAVSARSFDLDSIAEWGKFPRFVVNTYRWGNNFFNGYDTTYVAGTGYKFNVKLTTDSWLDGYRFALPESKEIYMHGDPSTSVGLYLTYLALSVGYDVNVSKVFGGIDRSRERFRFGFNCMLFAAEFYMINNDVGSTIRKIGDTSNPIKPNLAFSGINNSTWGVDAYYFFNHKRYSEAASFNFSRIQKRSQGSFYTGFSIYTQKLDFDFAQLPESYRDLLPSDWGPDYHYRVDTHNYALRLGYGYNWLFARNWVLGVSESPIIGVRKGFVTPWEDGTKEKVSLSLYNRLKLSVVWNSGRWFFGAVGKFDVAIINNHQTTYTGGVLSGEAVLGFRFNLW